MSVGLDEEAQRQRRVHGPDWRWQRALANASSTATGRTDTEDPQVRDALAYLRLRAGDRKQKARAGREFPHIAAATRLAKANSRTRQLKVLVLGGCPPAEIGARLSLEAKVLATWEGLFFDVRSAREATDWIRGKVIEPEQKSDGQLAAQLKFASAGGTQAARAILDAEARLSLREGQTLFDRKVRLHLKFAEAAQVPLTTERDKLRFIKMHAELKYQEQRLRLAERRLAQRCQEALWKHQVAERRLELRRRGDEEQAERAAGREAERARKRALRQAHQLQRQADSRARAEVRHERCQAAQERAARSALAQVTWEYTVVAGKESDRGHSGDPAQDKVELSDSTLAHRPDFLAAVFASSADAVDEGLEDEAGAVRRRERVVLVLS
jgi:hypothetical protein